MDEFLVKRFIDEIKLQCRFALAAYSWIYQQLEQLPQRGQELERLQSEMRTRHWQNFPVMRSDNMDEAELKRRGIESFHRQGQEIEELYMEFGGWNVWFFIYSFLVHSAIVSKIMWPDERILPNEKRAVGLGNVEKLENLRRSRGATIRNALEITGAWDIQNNSLRNDLEHYDARMEVWFLTSPGHNTSDMHIGRHIQMSGNVGPMDSRRGFNPSTSTLYYEGSEYNLSSIKSEIEDIMKRCKKWDLDYRIRQSLEMEEDMKS